MRHWPNWTDEALRGLDTNRLLVSVDGDDIVGVCAWGTHRRHWLGPIAVNRGENQRGVGRPLLLAALGRMRADGLTTAEIVWVGPVPFYARTVGATIGPVALVYRKDRRSP